MAPGEYPLRSTLKIGKARSLTLIGAGSATVLVAPPPQVEPLPPKQVGILVESSVDVSLERFVLLAGAAYELADTVPKFGHGSGTEIAIALVNTLECRVERCFIANGDITSEQPQTTVGIGLAGWALRPRLLDNVVLADIAIGDLTPIRTTHSLKPPGPPGPTGLARPATLGRGPAALTSVPAYLATADLAIEDNLLIGARYGIDVGASALDDENDTSPRMYTGATRIERNSVVGGREAGMSLFGIGIHGRAVGDAGLHALLPVVVGPLERVTVVIVADNVVSVRGDGIRADVDELRVERNTLSGAGVDENTPFFTGIRIRSRTDRPESVVRLCSNTIAEFSKAGIDVKSELGAVEIAQNRLMQLGYDGIVASGYSQALAEVRIDDNVLVNVGLLQGGIGFGIQAMETRRAMVCRNLVRFFGRDMADGTRVALSIASCISAQVDGNVLTDLGPQVESEGAMIGIKARGFGLLDVACNEVVFANESHSIALVIGEAQSLDTARKDLPERLPRPGPVQKRGSELLVHGNSLFGPGVVQPVVLIKGHGVTMSDNYCCSMANSLTIPVVFVDILGAMIVASNRVEGPSATKSGQVAVELYVPTTTPPCTVLGNITNGPIELNGSMLAPPWAPLNIVT